MEFEVNDLVLEQEPLKVKKIEIKLAELKFNESVTFYVYFFKEPNNSHCHKHFDTHYIKMETVKIEGDEYKEWKNDDNYIIELVCQKLGVNINNDVNNNDETVNDISNETLGIEEN